MKIYCTECGKEFEPELKVDKFDGGVEKAYFVCPHCGEMFDGFYTNESIRKKQVKIRKLWKKVEMSKFPINQERLYRKATNLQAEIKSDMRKLRMKFED